MTMHPMCDWLLELAGSSSSKPSVRWSYPARSLSRAELTFAVGLNILESGQEREEREESEE